MAIYFDPPPDGSAKRGRAKALRIPRITMTITNSINVKPEFGARLRVVPDNIKPNAAWLN
jgi:hypothetical protein